MTAPIALTLIILAAAIVLLSLEWVPPDVVALGVLLVLVLTGLLPTEQAFGGFASDTLLVLLGLFILTAALMATGVVDLSGRAILRLTGNDPHRLLTVIMWASAALGAFISNTASTAFFVPIVIGLAKRARISPSRLLMPLAFASILTSSVTLVSTSTNVVVSGLITRHGEPPMGMFELAPVGVVVSIVGLIYMQLLGRQLTPDRVQPTELGDDLADRKYLTEVLIRDDSSLVGKSLSEAGLGRDLDLTVVRIIGGQGRYVSPHGNRRLRAGHVLLVQGHPSNIAALGEDRTFSLIGAVNRERLNRRKAPIAVAAFLGVLVTAAAGWLTLPAAILLGVLIVFLSGCIAPDQAYREVDWRALILIGSMLGMGAAMQETGTADYLATQIVRLVGRSNPLWLLSAFFALAVAASTSYLTPLEPACLMVYGPGGYRFADFLMVGAPLTVLVYLVAIVLVPAIWPLVPG